MTDIHTMTNKEKRRYRRRMKLIRRSKLFQADWYKSQYPEVDFSLISPEEHFDRYGWKEGKDPSPLFSTNAYLEYHEDVKWHGDNPLVHYEQYGREEGRKIKGNPSYKKQDYSFTLSQKLRFYWERWQGKRKYASLIEKNKDARILVCLHLFYMQSWPLLSLYLENLKSYSFDLIVTYVDGMYDNLTLNKVKEEYPQAKLLKYPNQGFDIGSFVDVLQSINLDEYDIVFKLHSKGISRPFLFMYDQIFKKKDWFFNLFNGVLSGINVHLTIDKLMNKKQVGLVAAENLIIKDPLHKQHFTGKIAEQVGININKEYHFVAGTCFAVKAALLKPIQNLGMSIDDFAQTARGTFSLAHGMERIVCACVEPAGYTMEGNPTARPIYRDELEERRKTSTIKMLHDNRFKLDYEFFYKTLETAQIAHYEVVDIRLGDIRRKWKREAIPLEECHPYKYLKGEIEQYERYTEENLKRFGFSMSPERFETLKQSLEGGFDPLFMPVLEEDNSLRDGQHRSCLLLYKYGPDHVIKALKLYRPAKKKK